MTSSPLGQCRHVIGVDAGGSKTVALLAQVDASEQPPRMIELGRGKAGPGNPIATGWEAARDAIRRGVDQAFAGTGIPRQSVDALCLAVAGGGTDAVRERFESWGLEAGLAARIRVVTDGHAVLAAGTSQGVGLALIAGTGSLALARTESGELLRCGGWGYRLGDEGGGYWLGLEALRAVTEMEDGRRPPTMLRDVLLEAWGAVDARRVVEEIARGETESPTALRGRIAGLAPSVFQLAERQDAAAREVVDSAAGELQRQVVALLCRIGTVAGDFEMALAGSLLVRSDVLADRLLEKLMRAGCRPRRVSRVSDPERGAARIAAELLRTS